MKKRLLADLHKYFTALDIAIISEERKSDLQGLIDYAQQKIQEKESLILNFVCTHNSRRSQISQIMAAVASYYYEVDSVCYSGGTEETAFHPNAIAAIQRTGIDIDIYKGNNPIVFVRYSMDEAPLSCFSKVYDHPYNKAENFAAIMTCSHADENCPVILNAERIPVRYSDPKRADGTDQMEIVYDDTVQIIATEMKYVFQKLASS